MEDKGEEESDKEEREMGFGIFEEWFEECGWSDVIRKDKE